jgi:hypothetical protein
VIALTAIACTVNLRETCVVDTVPPPTSAVDVALTVTLLSLGTTAVWIVKLALVPLAGTVTDGGGVAAGLFEVRGMLSPPEGAGPLSVIVAETGWEPVTVGSAAVNAETDGRRMVSVATPGTAVFGPTVICTAVSVATGKALIVN